MSGLPYTVANGTCVHNEEVEQVWERPWSLDEIRKTSANWSLAADSGLFLFLQDFSQRMLSRTHEIEKQLDGLIRDTKATDCCLHSVFNDFLMLSNTQFIENRVYDEEVEEGTPKPEAAERQPEQEKTREQKEAELIPKVQEAVNYGLRVLESAFEQLDIKAGNSDSEDEEAIDRVEPILEPKDLYLDRPLPYLIGSQLFMEQDDVGLGDLSSEEMSMDSDRDSVIDSEEDKDEDQSDDDFDQNEEGQGSVKKKSSVMSDEEDVEDDEEDDSDIFGESDKEDDEDDKKSSAGPSSFADELAARIKGDTASKPEVDRSPLTSAPSSTKKSKGKRESKAEKAQAVDDSDDLFKPPDMEDEEFSPFGGRGGLFSGGTGLFDDDDEGDLFSDVPKNYPEGGVVKTATDKEPVSSKSNKKIPVGAVSIFPENAPFGSTSDSDLSERKGVSENKPQAAVKKAPLGGLFDDDEEDDFFSGNAIKKSSSVGQAKPKQKKVLDLFGGDEDNDEDGDIFNKSSSVAPEEVEEERTTKMPERKMPAGATSMFGAQTKNLLQDALRRREGAGRSEESIPSADTAKPREETQARSLFSDDEDSQIFPSSKSQLRHEPAAKNEKSKAPLSIFDDEEEEDLFATAPPKLRTNNVKIEVPKQASKPVSSALFSDDEDQWLSSKPSAAKSGVKSGGMKVSVSAPSSLPNVKAPQKQSTRSLFDDDDDDLFAATKDSSQKKSQRVSLLFEEEDEVEGRGLLFGDNPASGNTAPNTSATLPSVPSLFDSNVAEDEVSKPARETPPPGEVLQTQATQNARMPTGAVGLFGGIDVLGEKPVTVKTKSPLDDLDEDDFVYKDGPPPMDEKPKAKKKVLSLFDDEDEEDDEEEAMPTPVPNEPVAKNTLKPQEQRSRARSTGVFKDEELLFSQKQQKDNDPDVDLFATSAKLPVPKPSSNRPAAPLLFADDDEGDLFGPTKSQAPPKTPEKPPKPSKEGFAIRAGSSVPAADGQTPAIPVKSKEPSSRIGKLQANLGINPSSLLPSAVPRLPRETVTFPGQPSDTATSSAPQMSREGGVSFDKPAQVATLQSANKGRPKGAGHRRPQTRAARHLAAQLSDEHRDDGGLQPGSSDAHLKGARSPQEDSAHQPGSSGAHLKGASSPREDSAHQPGSSGAQSNGGGSPREDGAFQPGSSLGQPSLQPRVSDTPAKPSVLRLPSPTPLQSASPESGEDGSISTPSEDLFKSDDLFATSDKQVPTAKPETKTPEGAPSVGLKKEVPPSIFDDHGGDLFEKVKRKPAKKPKAVPFLDEDDDDLFTTGKGHGVKKSEKAEADTPKHAVFQDEMIGDQIPKKTKEKVLDASLFDDNVDIFADLTATAAPKEKKSKKKVETKSIFDDDMDDIFSPSNVKAVAKSQSRSKATQPVQDPSATEDTGLSIFDDPLNALGGV